VIIKPLVNTISKQKLSKIKNHKTMSQFSNVKYFTLKEFPQVGKLVLVKPPPANNGWYGLRYLAENKILVYNEYHESELEPYIEPTQPDFGFISL
jgi:hypothetical protein